jgi:hypothetical protein
MLAPASSHPFIRRTFADVRGRARTNFRSTVLHLRTSLPVRRCRPPQNREKWPLLAIQTRASPALWRTPSDLGASPDEILIRITEISDRRRAHRFAVIREM